THVVLHQAARATQFIDRVEVADKRHPGICCFTVLFIKVLTSREIRHVDANQRCFETASAGADAHIPAARRLFCRFALASKKVIGHVQSLRREDIDLARKQRMYLLGRSANGGSCSYDLW